MKRFLIICMMIMSFGLMGMVIQDDVPGDDPRVFLYVDAAPHIYLSSDYGAWEDYAFLAAAAGSFRNMGHSANPFNIDTTHFEIEDEVVYNIENLEDSGKRLTFIYWIPGHTVEDLTGRFSVALFNTWDCDLLDFYDCYYGETWLEPTEWKNYDHDGDGLIDGVIGTAGTAWRGAYGTDNQDDLDADLAEWGPISESWEFKVDFAGDIHSITVNRLPSCITELFHDQSNVIGYFHDCKENAKNHGQFVKCIVKKANELKKAGMISGKEKGAIANCAAESCRPGSPRIRPYSEIE